jgi:UDP-N-acetylglucosamine--dolichyl-phosphate N-acetylglucosaminephosphotransferase
LHLLSSLGAVRFSIHPSTGTINETTNLTILNAFLVRLGPMNEKSLVKVLIGTQVRYPDPLHFITY